MNTIHDIYIYNESCIPVYFKPVFPRVFIGTKWTRVRPSHIEKIWDAVQEEMHVIIICRSGIFIHSATGYKSIVVDDKIDSGINAPYRTSDIFPVALKDFSAQVSARDLLQINCDLKDIMRYAQSENIGIHFM
ncbi:hypothetical protein FB639_005147 [Coemansia asiatica]|nr:hypothetical protein FB639_005147 [Coemansia asiatica]